MNKLTGFFILVLPINLFAHGYLVSEPRPCGDPKLWLLYKSGSQWRIVHNIEEYCNVYNLFINEQNRTVTFTATPGSTWFATWPYTKVVSLPEGMCSSCPLSGLQEQEVEFDGIIQ